MPTLLSLHEHLAGLASSGAALRDAAAAAGLASTVPTCPDWDVTTLVIHQGMVHRWAAANLRGQADHSASDSTAEGRAAADVLAWYTEGLGALVETISTTPENATAMVFLRDAPPPRQFWARRQCHETTIHSVDAISAGLGRWPTAAETGIEPLLAADGVDELLTGFITRGKGQLHASEPYLILVQASDTGHAWTVRVSDGPTVTTVGPTAQPDVVFAGTAGQLYLSLWNRADEISTDGPPDVLDQWRSLVRVRWS
jgi:uncharacterized protein (TIGR03083 family)